jgi:hypothetical protein
MIGRVKAQITATLLAGALFAGVGAGTARAAFVLEAGSPFPVGNAPYNVYTGDFNGDGLADVATINGTSSDVSVYLRNPTGGFTQEAGSPFAGGAGNGSAAVGDFDGNGLTDLITTNYVESTVSVLLAQPGGGFALQNGTRQPLSGGPQAAASGDFNADGRLDYVVSLYNQNVVAVMTNTANGFTETSAFGGTGQPSTPVVADFDGDGRLDYAFVNTSGGSVTVVRQPGGQFTADTSIPIGTSPAGIAAGDFNGDGRPDLAITRAVDPGNVVVLLRNASNDGFTAAPYSPLAVSSTPVAITAADFNVDGRPDLALAAASGAVDVLENTGAGFTDTAIPMSATSQSGIAAADFDGDGRPDIVASEYASNTFSTLLNPGAPVAPPPAPTPTPTPTPTPAPTPVAGVNVIGSIKSGTVTFKKPGSKTYVKLAPGTSIPVGSTIDTREGKVTITAAQGGGKISSAWFYDGLFKLTQTKGSKPLTTLALVEELDCSKRGSASSSATKAKKKQPSSRKLWGDGKGSFQTKGEFSAATVRGTKWLVQDTCAATLTRVARGVVDVRDFVKDKTVTVRAGKSYTARRKR